MIWRRTSFATPCETCFLWKFPSQWLHSTCVAVLLITADNEMMRLCLISHLCILEWAPYVRWAQRNYIFAFKLFLFGTHNGVSMPSCYTTFVAVFINSHDAVCLESREVRRKHLMSKQNSWAQIENYLANTVSIIRSKAINAYLSYLFIIFFHLGIRSSRIYLIPQFISSFIIPVAN